MAFLAPLFLAGAAAIAIPIAIHLFYRRAEPVVEFAATRYLRRAPVEQAQRRRLRELLLLALRVAALVMLALAFARPYFSQSAAALGAPATVVLLDTSASLSAPGQFERARARAVQAVRSAPADNAVAVFTFGAGTTAIAPLSQDCGGAVAALARVKPGAGATRYHAALARAAEECGERSGRIVVVTDLQQAGWDAADQGGVPDRIAIEVEDVGGPASNVALTSLRLDGTEAVAIVQNYATRAMPTEVVFTIEDRRIGAVPITPEANGSAEARLSLDEHPSGRLVAAVTDREGYAADNVRYAVLDAADTPLILTVTASGNPSEAFYLERALAIAEGAGGFRFRAVSGQAFSDLDAPAIEASSVVVILGTRGIEQRGRETLGGFVRSGGGLLVAAGPDVDPAIVGDALRGIVRTSWRSRDSLPLHFAPDDGRHPVFRLFGGVGALGNVTFRRSTLIDVPESADVVARYSYGSPALVEERTGSGRVLVFASDVNDQWNDFPVQPAFVPFVHETLRYLAATRASRTEYFVGDLPGDAGLTPGVVSLGAASQSPVGQTRSGLSSAARRVAVNVDPRESDPRRMTADEFQAGVSRMNATAGRQARSEAREQEDNQRLWQYALLLMVVSLAAEGMLGRRLG